VRRKERKKPRFPATQESSSVTLFRRGGGGLRGSPFLPYEVKPPLSTRPRSHSAYFIAGERQGRLLRTVLKTGYVHLLRMSKNLGFLEQERERRKKGVHLEVPGLGLDVVKETTALVVYYRREREGKRKKKRSGLLIPLRRKNQSSRP